MSLTEDAAKVSGIPYVMDAYRTEAEAILNGKGNGSLRSHVNNRRQKVTAGGKHGEDRVCVTCGQTSRCIYNNGRFKAVCEEFSNGPEASLRRGLRPKKAKSLCETAKLKANRSQA